MTNLNIYRFELLNKVKEQQVLSFYNEEEDLLNTMDNFCGYIHENILEYTDNQGKHRTFTLGNIQNKNETERIISGYLDSAYTGEKGKVKDRKTNLSKFDISEKDLFSKDFFYMIHVPKNSKIGFLIVERKENHGVKSIFENAFNNFMRSKGVANYTLNIRQAPPRYFIQNFIKKGKLKEFRLIENISNMNSSNLNLGKEVRVIKIKNDIIQEENLKQLLLKLFYEFDCSTKKIPFLSEGEFDEIAFVLGIDNSTKTFYVKNHEKIRSNLDVSNLVDYENGLPTYESLIRVSLEIIRLAS